MFVRKLLLSSWLPIWLCATGPAHQRRIRQGQKAVSEECSIASCKQLQLNVSALRETWKLSGLHAGVVDICQS